MWNKKYPICIELAKQDDFLAKVQGDKSDVVVEEKTPTAGDRSEAVGTSEEPKRAHTEPVLYLFGRTGRDKEEWFRRMLLASKLKSEAKKPSGLPTSKKFTNGPFIQVISTFIKKKYICNDSTILGFSEVGVINFNSFVWKLQQI